MTIEQKRAVAVASARARAASATTPDDSAAPPSEGVNVTIRPDSRDNLFGKVDTAVRGIADAATFSFADELAAGLQTGGGLWGDYDKALASERAIDASDAENRPVSRIVGQIAGGVGTGVGLATSGLSLAARSAQAGSSLGKISGASLVDGGVAGLLAGAGSGEGIEGRLKAAGIGAAVGGGLGGLAPAAGRIIEAAGTGASSWILARLKPDDFAGRALASALVKSGKSPEEIERLMIAAGRDMQSEYTVADAMGNAGQRALSPVTRTPNDARQPIVEGLLARQEGQAGRLGSAVDEAFNAGQTSRQSAADLRKWGQDASRPFYEQALSETPVYDERLGQFLADPIMKSGLREGLEVQRLESLARGEKFDPYDYIEGFDDAGDPIVQQVPNMRTINVAKKGIDNILEGYRDSATGRLMLDERGRAIDEVRRAFLNQVDELNPAYKQARSLYAGPAQIADAQQRGTMAATRGRAADNIDDFSRLQPPSQQGFRIGYADKLNESIERGAPGVNKARALTSQKTRQELSEFAAPGRAEKLGRQVERENTMFATSNAALGGSKTSDNIADAAEMAGFDPEVLNNLFQGRPVAAALAAGKRLFNEGKGMPPRVIERVGRALVETRPEVARAILEQAQAAGQVNANQRALVSSIITASTALPAGRIAGNSNRLEVTIRP